MHRSYAVLVYAFVVTMAGIAGCSTNAPTVIGGSGDVVSGPVPRPGPGDAILTRNRKALECSKLQAIDFKTRVSPADPADPIRIEIPEYGHVLKVPKSALNGVTTFRIMAQTHKSRFISRDPPRARVWIAAEPLLRAGSVLFLDLNYAHCRRPIDPRGGFYADSEDSGSIEESGTNNSATRMVEDVRVTRFGDFNLLPAPAGMGLPGEDVRRGGNFNLLPTIRGGTGVLLQVPSGYAVASN